MRADETAAVTTQRPQSVVMVEVNGQQYPMKSVASCYTCQSPHRLEVEQMICAGGSYQTVADSLVGRPHGRKPHPGASNIKRHVDEDHMPLTQTLQHSLIKERSKELGRSLETHTGTLVDYVAANRMVIQKAMDRMAKGELEPNVAEMLTAIRMEHTVQQSVDGGLDAAAWQDAMLVYMEVAQQFIPTERMNEYGRALASHPVLRGIISGESRVIQGAVSNG